MTQNYLNKPFLILERPEGEFAQYDFPDFNNKEVLNEMLSHRRFAFRHLYCEPVIAVVGDNVRETDKFEYFPDEGRYYVTRK